MSPYGKAASGNPASGFISSESLYIEPQSSPEMTSLSSSPNLSVSSISFNDLPHPCHPSSLPIQLGTAIPPTVDEQLHFNDPPHSRPLNSSNSNVQPSRPVAARASFNLREHPLTKFLSPANGKSIHPFTLLQIVKSSLLLAPPPSLSSSTRARNLLPLQPGESLKRSWTLPRNNPIELHTKYGAKSINRSGRPTHSVIPAQSLFPTHHTMPHRQD